ncbi:MAG TPA: hypothetical protein VGW33_11715 [Terriglobia bacterium]|nr:hypothetical protein [Terriglobia bacterium]
MNSQIWAATAIIVVGYILGFYFNHREVESLRRAMESLRREMETRFAAIDKRFDDLKDWIRAELRRIDERLDRLEHPLVKN